MIFVRQLRIQHILGFVLIFLKILKEVRLEVLAQEKKSLEAKFIRKSVFIKWIYEEEKALILSCSTSS